MDAHGAKAISILVVTLVLLGGCSSGSKPRGAQSGARPTATVSSPSPKAQGSSVSPEPTKSDAEKKKRATPAPSRTMEDAFGGMRTFPLTVTADPQCTSHGQKARLIIKTDPSIRLSISVIYADQNHHGTFGVGVTDKNGLYVFAFTVPPTAPEGWAIGDVVALGEEGDSSATGEDPFRVTLPGGCG